MENITKIEITVATKTPLTLEQQAQILIDMKYRLEGYATTPPDCMIDSDIRIKLMDDK